MDDLVIARRVTANVWFWQGLRWAPGGLVFLLVALTALLPRGWTLLQWLCWTGAIALWWYLCRAADSYRASTGGGRAHYFVGAALLSALTPLPLAGVVEPGRPIVILWAATVGALYLVLGSLDHLELVRRFPMHDES